MEFKGSVIDFVQLKKNLKKDFSMLPKYKLAILGDSSTQLISQAIRSLGFDSQISFEIYESDYGQIEQEIFNLESGLYGFAPECIIIFQSTQHLVDKFYTSQVKSEFAEDHINGVDVIINHLNGHIGAKIVYSNFVEIQDGVFGNYGSKVSSSFTYQLRKINFKLMDLAGRYKNLFISDTSNLNNRVGTNCSFTPSMYINNDIVFSLDFVVIFSINMVDILLAFKGRLVKCLVLDLDNTLWGGIIGDDGIDNIEIGELGIGKAFSKFQQWIKQLKLRGVILAICSKNNEVLAKEPFEKHPDMVLRLDDIAVFIANWESKADNIRHIREVLNIGFDSMVFIDDNPAERESVKQEIPALIIPEMPEDPAEFLPFLTELNLFETTSFLSEDSSRTKQYQDEAKRIEFKKTVGSGESYLKKLGMTSEVKYFEEFNAPRVAQLTQRSNQFNLRTVRYTEDEILKIGTDTKYISLAFNLKDKFGENGLISAVAGKIEEHYLFIELWVMSCRVLKRDMEKFIINELAKEARLRGLKSIVGEYLETKKNALVANLYDSLGFVNENGLWVLSLEGFEPFNTFINAEYSRVS